MTRLITILLFCISSCCLIQETNAKTVDHSKHKMKSQTAKSACAEGIMACAKTISSVADKQGRIWSTWSHQKYLYLNYSDDLGRSYSAPMLVNQIAEKISTRGENRPKIGVDGHGNVYLSWVTPLSKRFTANVRFSYFSVNSQQFSAPITINNDNLLTGHSFNEMVVTQDGDVYISWLDGRAKVAAAKKGIRLRNSELYLAHANFVRGKTEFDNNFLAKGTCVCCRLAMDLDEQELPMLMWRHVFGDNYRDHGFLTMKNQKQANEMKRVSFENWQVDGCPHQGPSIARETKGKNINRVHMAWFNNAPNASGLFYGYSDDNGNSMSKVNHFAQKNFNPEHPHLSQNQKAKKDTERLGLVWREFNGKTFQVKYQSSRNGDHWSKPRVIASAEQGVDYPYILQHPSGNYLHWHISGQALELIKL